MRIRFCFAAARAERSICIPILVPHISRNDSLTAVNNTKKKVSIFVAVLILIRIRFGCLSSSTGSIITQFIWRHIAHTTYIRAHENALHWRARTKPFASATAADPMLRRSSTHVPYRCYTSFILCNHSMPTLIHRFNAQCWIHLTYKQTCSFCSFRSFDLRQIKYFSFVFLIESNNSG